MEQLSFASVYRTAAILAAFSHASAAGDEADGRAPWPRGAANAPGASQGLHAGHTFLRVLRECFCRRRTSRPPHRFAIEVTRPYGWDVHEHADIWMSIGPHRPCVTSHFAFAEDAERVISTPS